ncbi:siderophore ferric iron reductase [Marinomonas mediterranea]|jgi:FhuF 2Fe-2S C-terminal domain.|uniref:Ferric siderophore reductase C-terminal domain-containing protein n=1 Tax=Marinomonas mediterranea (strain ATCC 700492 / JCM 21426 / NBRC 103028 / MMB-1) TaxID=717774 RepID=F2JZB7_MARM1|nr:siderophore ferric iron reductase [Marinomonas mediterranea]ADZ93202.1 hypothetical protein Marme_3994 [Marinomonas mediterranea MMB-1]WCN15156.1 siderophore ferric iron reductase [Marinomonas mediterranea]WCN19200.1 siderophore ferric iron reductase [Marinomonas mediterranea MMB-1]
MTDHVLHVHYDQALIDLAQSYLPPLVGMAVPQKGMIHPDSESTVVPLIEALSRAHPEAKVGYWRARSWALLCWQPIYLAMICVYRLHAVPQGLSRIEQRRIGNSVAGYYLPKGDWYVSENTEHCIVWSGEFITQLFRKLESAIAKQVGGRGHYYKALLADQVILVLEHVSTVYPELTYDWVISQYDLWRRSLVLPKIETARFTLSTEQTYLRRSCCLQFRCANGELCSNCPRSNFRA